MNYNPLVAAVDAYELTLDTQGELMWAFGGDEEFDEELCNRIGDLVVDSWTAVQKLHPRSRRARLNLLWREFMRGSREYRRYRVLRSEGFPATIRPGGDDMSHPGGTSDIQGAGGAHEPTEVNEAPHGKVAGGGHQRETNADAAGNSSARPAQTLAELEAQGTIGPKGPVQSVDVKTDVSGSRDYKRVPLTQEMVAGYGAVAQGGPKASDGRKK